MENSKQPEIPTTNPSRSKVLHSREKEIINNVHKYFLEEKACGGCIIPPSKAIARTAKAVNVSERTVKRICSEERTTSPEHPILMSPPTRKRSSPVTNFDDFDQDVLRRTVLGFYDRKELPTLLKIQQEMNDKNGFKGSLSSLRTVMLNIGFEFATVDGRKFLMERSDIAAARTTFLREMKEIKQSSRTIVYLDETWVNQNYTVAKCWQDTTSPGGSGVQQPTGKGSRLIIVHAGTKNGFIPNASLVFQAKNDGDYHHQMNATLFEKWFREQLLPNIPSHSVIVMDNAPYHSVKLEKRPTTAWKKADLLAWIVNKGVEPQKNSTKAQLQELAKKIQVPTAYVIDKIAEEAGHRVVRLPPYHCQYNPIELIWAQVKNNVAKKNTFKMRDLKPLLEESLTHVTQHNWTKAVRHAEELRDQDGKRDIAAEKFIESFIVNITEASGSEDSD